MVGPGTWSGAAMMGTEGDKSSVFMILREGHFTTSERMILSGKPRAAASAGELI